MSTKQAKVAVVHNGMSEITKRGSNLARYLSSCLSVSGWCSKVYLVDVSRKPNSANSGTEYQVLRRDNAVIPSNLVTQTREKQVVGQCDVLFLCCDVLDISSVINDLKKYIERNKHLIVIRLESSLKRMEGFDTLLPDHIALQGGSCFQVVRNERTKQYMPLSNGIIFIERLSKDKESALFCFDMIESCGLQVLSRKNLRAVQWANGILSLIYAISALTGMTVLDALKDRRCRLIYADMLHEVTSILDEVVKDKKWMLDTGGNCFLSVNMILLFLPLPNWIFNTILLKWFDFGTVTPQDGYPILHSDIRDHLTTEFQFEYDDVLELAASANVTMQTLPKIRELILQIAKDKKGCPNISSSVLYQTINPSAASRNHSKMFMLKIVITIFATFLLIWALR